MHQDLKPNCISNLLKRQRQYVLAQCDDDDDVDDTSLFKQVDKSECCSSINAGTFMH